MNKINPSIKILSLDGGGIRASYVQLLILEEIEKICKIPIKKLFNFIIGTSAGAILGSNITYDKENESLKEFKNSILVVKNIIIKNNICNLLFNHYRVPINRIYNNLLLHNPCMNYYNNIPPTAELNDNNYTPYFSNIICKMIDNNWQPYIIRNYDVDDKICQNNNIKIKNLGSNQWNLLDQCWATCAIPTMFKEFTDSSNNKYIDYSFININPLLIGIQEVLHVFPKKNIDLIVSIGNTNIDKVNQNNKIDLCYWLKEVINFKNKNSESQNDRETVNIYINNILNNNGKLPLYIRFCPNFNNYFNPLETDTTKIIIFIKEIRQWISDNQEPFIILKNFFETNN